MTERQQAGVGSRMTIGEFLDAFKDVQRRHAHRWELAGNARPGFLRTINADGPGMCPLVAVAIDRNPSPPIHLLSPRSPVRDLAEAVGMNVEDARALINAADGGQAVEVKPTYSNVRNIEPPKPVQIDYDADLRASLIRAAGLEA